MSTTAVVDELRGKVKTVYQQVAADPHAGFHFETGRGLAERLGYEVDDLDRIPSAAIDSFAGVGYHMDLARLTGARRVLDLGSGSGMDSFVSDIVTEKELTESIVCDTSLWAACIGGAAQQERYRAMVEAAGLRVEAVRDNPQYQFLSTSARGASETFGVKSVSLAATKPA
jgi:hypothetical protein